MQMNLTVMQWLLLTRGIKLPAGTLFFPHTRLLLPLYYFAYTTIKRQANKIFGSGRVRKQMQINASLHVGVVYIVVCASS